MEMDLDILLRHQDAEEFDLFRAIADMGVHYSERPLPGSESGRIWRDGSRFTILVNSRLPAGRRRFSAAHQLAHYMFLRDLLPECRGLTVRIDPPNLIASSFEQIEQHIPSVRAKPHSA